MVKETRKLADDIGEKIYRQLTEDATVIPAAHWYADLIFAECSRLASRVEELEEDLRVAEFNLRAYELGFNTLKERVKELQNGAGAHAEEKR